MAADRNNLPVIVDAECLQQLPSSARVEELVEIVHLVVAVDEAVKVPVARSQRTADDFSVVVQGASDAERTAEGSEHAAVSAFLAEGFDAAGLGIEGYPHDLGKIVNSEHIVPV